MNLPEVYANVPQIACKGHCVESCGPIAMSRKEAQAIRKAAPRAPVMRVDDVYQLRVKNNLTCPLLKQGRCSVYDVRPMICRLWGVVPEMPCEWGCTPIRTISSQEGRNLLRQSLEAGK